MTADHAAMSRVLALYEDAQRTEYTGDLIDMEDAKDRYRSALLAAAAKRDELIAAGEAWGQAADDLHDASSALSWIGEAIARANKRS